MAASLIHNVGQALKMVYFTRGGRMEVSERERERERGRMGGI